MKLYNLDGTRVKPLRDVVASGQRIFCVFCGRKMKRGKYHRKCRALMLERLDSVLRSAGVEGGDG